MFLSLTFNFYLLRDHLQISLLILSEFKRINQFLFPFEIIRSSHQRCSVKKVFLEISQNSQENTCGRDSFLIKLQASCYTPAKTSKNLWFSDVFMGYKKEGCNFIKKETLAQVFSCEFCEISKNTSFYRTTLVAASEKTICFLIISGEIEVD